MESSGGRLDVERGREVYSTLATVMYVVDVFPPLLLRRHFLSHKILEIGDRSLELVGWTVGLSTIGPSVRRPLGMNTKPKLVKRWGGRQQ